MNSRICPQCHFNTSVKIGITTAGKQRYRCRKCNKTWVTKSRPSRIKDKIWYDFVFNNLTARTLAEKYHKSKRSIYDILEHYQVKSIIPPYGYPTRVVCVDVTYVGRKYGFLSVLDAHTGICLYCALTRGYETVWDYEKALLVLHEYHIFPKAVVIDGKKSVIEMFERYGLKVQFCQFHMLKIVTKYLTRKPVLVPNIELRSISLTLTKVHQESFETMFYSWMSRYSEWLNERRYNECGKWEFVHKGTRALIKSYKTFLPYLFTFEQYPELKIPNTNNLIEGVHSALKSKLFTHRGSKKALKTKIVFSFLSGRTEV